MEILINTMNLFKNAASFVLERASSLDENAKLELYALYKQVTLGDCIGISIIRDQTFPN